MNGIGYVQSVRNQEKKTGGFFPIAMVVMEGMTEPYNMAYFGKSDIHSAVNHRIELEWDEEPKGAYMNRTIQSFKVLPASLQPSPTSSGVGIAHAAPMGDPKQENINRQSAWNQAVNLVSAALDGGYNVVVGDSKKAKSAAKDPEVLFEWARYTARRIKEDVQQGDWSTVKEAEEQGTQSATDDDIPF